MNELTDDQLSALVRSADRPRPVSESERRRMRAALGGSVQTAELEPVELPSGSRLTSDDQVRRGSRRTLILGAAAAVVAVLAVLGAWRVRPAEAPATSMPVPETSAEVREICRDELTELSAAVAAWGSVADWSVSIDGEPNLAVLTAGTIAALVEVDESLAAMSDQVAAVVDERTSFELPPGAVLDEHAAVVRAGLLAVVEAVARLDPGRECDVTLIKMSLTG